MPSASHKALYAGVLLLVVAAGFFRISDLDFWWHLKTGQVIVEQKEFQHREIFSFTAPGREYIDHEWLFQVFCYLAYLAAGPLGVILLKCAILCTIYLLAARHLLRNGSGVLAAAGILTLSVIGGLPRFIERPEVFSTLFLILIFLSLDSYLRTGSIHRLIVIPLITLVWANLHAAVLLGLLLQLMFLGGAIAERYVLRGRYPVHYDPSARHISLIGITLVVSFLATLVNPYGFRVLKVPFELTAIINTGLLNNQEWQRPSPYTLPLFYVCLLFTFAVQAANFRKLSVIHFVFSSFLGYIAMQYFRNTGMFCMLSPFLVAPYVRSLSTHVQPVRLGAVALLIPAVMVLTTSFPFQRGAGVATYFPEKIVQFTMKQDLQGNMLNSYAFGGYLIWRLYPQRKIFIDGRNEVFLPLLQQLVASRSDSRVWYKLLADYKIEYAVLNYVDDLEEVTIMKPDGKADKTYLPFTMTRFPRSRWALVYWDDNGMIWIRRTGANQRLLSMEYTSIYPEGHGFQESMILSGRLDKNVVKSELKRKLKEDPGCTRAKNLLGALQ